MPCFLHYPPQYNNNKPRKIILFKLILKLICYTGHILRVRHPKCSQWYYSTIKIQNISIIPEMTIGQEGQGRNPVSFSSVTTWHLLLSDYQIGIPQTYRISDQQ
jgi:hypothetical protein